MSFWRPVFGMSLVVLMLAMGCGGSSHEENGACFITRAVQVGDFNGDRLPDVASLNGWEEAAANRNGFVVFRFQDPAHLGRFAEPIRLEVGPDPQALLGVDMNQDGLLDLVIADASKDSAGFGLQIWLQSNMAKGSFRPPIRIPLGERRPRKLAAGDLNSDGMPDLAVASPGGKDLMVIYQGSSNQFKSPLLLPLEGEPTDVAIGPIQRLPKVQDLAVTTDQGTVNVLLQALNMINGFKPFQSHKVGLSPQSVAIGDLNGDGYADLITANAGDYRKQIPGGISVLIQNSMLDCVNCVGFLPSVGYSTYDFQTMDVSIADLDGDKLPDLVASNFGEPGDPGSVAVFFQNPSKKGAFLFPQMYPGYWGPAQTQLADVDGDQAPDMIVADGAPLIRFQDPGNPGWFLPPVTLRQ